MMLGGNCPGAWVPGRQTPFQCVLDVSKGACMGAGSFYQRLSLISIPGKSFTRI